MTRRCFKCEQVKPVESFHACRRDVLGIQKMCKSCVKAYHHANKVRLAALARETYKQDPEFQRERYKKYYEGKRRRNYYRVVVDDKHVWVYRDWRFQ